MGCDIHGCVEVFIKDEWVKTLDIGDISPRNYDLFSTFFGVRGNTPYRYGNRGLPEGASWRTCSQYCDQCEGNGRHDATIEERAKWERYHGDKDCEGCPDWHSLTYVTLEELDAHHEILTRVLHESTEWMFVFDMMHCFSLYVQRNVPLSVARTENDKSLVRLIVWFDN